MTTVTCALCSRYPEQGSSLCDRCQEKRFDETRHMLANFIDRLHTGDEVSLSEVMHFKHIAQKLNARHDSKNREIETLVYRQQQAKFAWQEERRELQQRLFALQEELRKSHLRSEGVSQ